MVSEQFNVQLCYWAQFAIWLDLNHRVAQWSSHIVWVCCQLEKQTHLTHLLRAMQVLCFSNSCSFQSCCPTLLSSLLLLWCSKKMKENYINQFFFLDSLSFFCPGWSLHCLTQTCSTCRHSLLFFLYGAPPRSITPEHPRPHHHPQPVCGFCVSLQPSLIVGETFIWNLLLRNHWTD